MTASSVRGWIKCSEQRLKWHCKWNMGEHGHTCLRYVACVSLIVHRCTLNRKFHISHIQLQDTVLETIGLARSLSKQKHLSWVSRDLSSIPESHIGRKNLLKVVLWPPHAHRGTQLTALTHNILSHSHTHTHTCTHSHSAHTYNTHTEEKLWCKINFSMCFGSI